MKLRSSTASMLIALLALAPLPTCQTLKTTRTVATETVDENRKDLCERAWLPTTYSSRDTVETQEGNRGNNARRAGYCGEFK